MHLIGVRMPIGYIRAMLAKAEHEYLEARRMTRAGLLGSACLARSQRDMWWNAYRIAKAKAI